MTAEWVTAFATLGTLVVIAASAVAALVQLRHMRAGNQIAVFNSVREHFDSPEFLRTLRFVRDEFPERIKEAKFRSDLLKARAPEYEAIRKLCNFLDSAAWPIKHQMVDRDLACDLWYGPVVICWDNLAPLIASERARLGYRIWEDLEYLALLCKRFRKRYPLGTYPQGEEPLPLPEPWPETFESRT